MSIISLVLYRGEAGTSSVADREPLAEDSEPRGEVGIEDIELGPKEDEKVVP